LAEVEGLEPEAGREPGEDSGRREEGILMRVLASGERRTLAEGRVKRLVVGKEAVMWGAGKEPAWKLAEEAAPWAVRKPEVVVIAFGVEAREVQEVVAEKGALVGVREMKEARAEMGQASKTLCS
jgi:hypothetical protein